MATHVSGRIVYIRHFEAVVGESISNSASQRTPILGNGPKDRPGSVTEFAASMLLAGHWNIDPGRLGVRICDCSEPAPRVTEKHNVGPSGGQAAISSGVNRP